MKIISIDGTNIDEEHICCAIGNDKANRARAETKKEWMKQRFREGLVFKRLDERGKVFVEYMPAAKAWKPVQAPNYMMINCLWVSGRFKGNGWSTKLLNECIADARAQKMNGVVVVTSNKVKPFLTDKRFYEKHGFAVVDTAPPYFELLALKFKSAAKNPAFTGDAREGTSAHKKGLAFVYSHQCPFMEEYTALLARMAKDRGIACKLHKLKDHKDAREHGSPFGTLGMYYKGRLVTHELMSEKKFEKFLETLK